MVGMKDYPDGYFDWAVCDIPYGINVGKMAYLQEKGVFAKQKNGTKMNANRNKEGYAKKDWDSAVPEQAYFDELCRISKNQIIFGVDYVDWKGLGSGRIKWDKLVAEGMSFNRYETAYCSAIDHEITIPLLWSGMMQAKSLQEPHVQQGNKKLNEKRIHPCHKPELLYLKLLLMFCKEGDKIIDTHVGGGSIRKACDRLKINFVGHEIDKDYFEKQQNQFNSYISKKIAKPTLF